MGKLQTQRGPLCWQLQMHLQRLLTSRWSHYSVATVWRRVCFAPAAPSQNHSGPGMSSSHTSARTRKEPSLKDAPLSPPSSSEWSESHKRELPRTKRSIVSSGSALPRCGEPPAHQPRNHMVGVQSSPMQRTTAFNNAPASKWRLAGNYVADASAAGPPKSATPLSGSTRARCIMQRLPLEVAIT